MIKWTLTKTNICNLLDQLDSIDEIAELIQYYIETRQGLKGYCRT